MNTRQFLELPVNVEAEEYVVSIVISLKHMIVRFCISIIGVHECTTDGQFFTPFVLRTWHIASSGQWAYRVFDPQNQPVRCHENHLPIIQSGNASWIVKGRWGIIDKSLSADAGKTHADCVKFIHAKTIRPG